MPLPSLRSPLGGIRLAQAILHHGFIGGGKALLGIWKVLVEGAGRDAGQASKVAHGDTLVAAFRAQLDHRAVETRSLVGEDLFRRTTRTGLELAVQRLAPPRISAAGLGRLNCGGCQCTPLPQARWTRSLSPGSGSGWFL